MNIELGTKTKKLIEELVIEGKWAHMQTEELKSDLDDAYSDLLASESALKLGIKEHRGINTEHRILENKKQIAIIELELKRRAGDDGEEL